jgi:signal peptidase II
MKIGAAALLLAIGFTLDVATKAWARATLDPYAAPLDFLTFVSLRLSFNLGVSFGIFASGSEGAWLVLVILTGLLTLALGVAAFRSHGWQRASLSLILAGAFANLIDRTINDSVTDFLGLHFGGWHPFVLKALAMRPDEDAYGVTYNQIDDFLEGKEIEPSSRARILRAYQVTAHKRALPVAPKASINQRP